MVVLRAQRNLTVILLGFNSWQRREDGPVRAGAEVTALSWHGELPGEFVPRRPPPWAFALRRAAVTWCDGFSAGAARPPSALRQHSSRAACAITRRQARGALGAPLKTY
jgi:hypothetical protein